MEEIEIIEDPEIDENNDNVETSNIWMSSLNVILNRAIHTHSKIDCRLEHIGIHDILYGQQTNRPIYDDADIKTFITDFLSEVDWIICNMHNKKLDIVEDDRNQYSRLNNLTYSKIYKRLSNRIN